MIGRVPGRIYKIYEVVVVQVDDCEVDARGAVALQLASALAAASAGCAHMAGQRVEYPADCARYDARLV